MSTIAGDPRSLLGVLPRDQATRLRAMVEAARVTDAGPARAAPPPRRARVIAVTSGKGGVGKTSTSVNLAIALVDLGFRTAVLDADLGMANADVLCGLAPTRRLDRLLDSMPVADIAVDAPGGFRLVPGSVGVARLAEFPPDARAALLNALDSLERDSDAVVVDTGAGLGPGVLAFGMGADLTLVVATPEPTSIADAYAMIKTLIQRRRDAPTPDVQLLVNQAMGIAEAVSVHARIAAVARRFLSCDLPFAGWIPRDVAVESAVRARSPVLLAHPGAPASKACRSLASGLVQSLNLATPASPVPRRTGFLSRLLR